MVKISREQYDKATDAFSKNLDVVLKNRNMNKAALGALMEKASPAVSQKSVYNVADLRHPPKVETLAAIAEKLEVPLWVMLIPELPAELLESAEMARFCRMVANYFDTRPDERKHIESTAATWSASRKLQDTGSSHPRLQFPEEE